LTSWNAAATPFGTPSVVSIIFTTPVPTRSGPTFRASVTPRGPQ
jgi:hypothetical protein